MPDLKRVKLIDGIVHMPSPVPGVHRDYHFRLSSWLTGYVLATNGGKAGIAGIWLMSEDSAPQPDLTLEVDPRVGGQARIEGDYPAGAPELVIEISHTTSAKDAGAKLRLYERGGALEYLTVRPRQQHRHSRACGIRRAAGSFAALIFDSLFQPVLREFH